MTAIHLACQAIRTGEIDVAIALLRPLAYSLHCAGQSEELAESDLIEHVFDRLAALGRSEVDPLGVFDWLYRDTGVLAELPLATSADLDEALAASAKGFALWRATDVNARAAVLFPAPMAPTHCATLSSRSSTIRPCHLSLRAAPVGSVCYISIPAT